LLRDINCKAWQQSKDYFKLKVATLPAIILLKIIAFQDRPEMRLKDPQDIYEIITHYFNLQSELIYDKHPDLFDQETELELISCRVIGREIRNIVSDNRVLQQRVVDSLVSEIDKSEKSVFLKSINYSDKHNPDQIINWLVKILSELGD
jgi:predicted nucleotidyltransferase